MLRLSISQFINLMTRLSLICATLFLLSACATDDPSQSATALIDNVIYVTATPDTTIPSATRTDLPPTTPSIDVQHQLQLGNVYITNGYYEEAISLFKQISLLDATNVSDQEQAEALFRLTQASVREGLFLEALDAANELISRFPDSSLNPQAHFLRGDAHLGLGQWQAAIDDFTYFETTRPGMIDSYVYERIADAQIALGLVDEAVLNYQLAIDANRSLVPQLILREKLASILKQNLRYDEAIAQYEAILAVAQNAPYRADIELAVANTYMEQDKLDLGLNRMQRIIDNYPETAAAYTAMQSLLANGEEIDSYRQGKIAYVYGDYQTAINAFNTYTSTHQLDAIPADLYLQLGRAYRELSNPQAAIIAFQTIINQYPNSSLFGEALLEQGRTYFLATDYEKAISTYLNVADNFSYLPEIAAEALWRAAYLYGTNEEPTLSRQVFQRLATEFPNSKLAVEGLFFAASSAVGSNDWAVAENLYSRIATIATGEDQAAGFFWVGRLARDRGDDALAQESFNLAISTAPDSYFAARSADLLQGLRPFTPPDAYQSFTFDDGQELADAETWLRTTFAIDQLEPLWQLSPELAQDPRLIRGQELWNLSAIDEALNEFDEIVDEAREMKDPLKSFQLAIFLRSIGAYYSSIVAAADVIKAGGVSTLEAPAYIAKMRYPTYYSDIVLDVATRYNMDPLLIFSLIRHESLFNTYATAAAGEKGLTQVIPGTAEYIALELNWPDYQHADLFRPYAGIEFGAFFLSEQLNRFNNNAIAALAGYNAGPGRAIDWMALSDGDPDRFMTAITIASTRLYIQRIYGYYNIYRALYGA
ncbi:transglycosylase SLT domain-containing protein [Anaerolineales bacterium]